MAKPGPLTTLGVLAFITFALVAQVRARAAAHLPGQVFITKKHFSQTGQPARASTVRSEEVRMVWPAEEEGNEVTKWKVDFVALLDQPLGDYQVELKFWDVTKGGARYVTSRVQLTRDKLARVVVGELGLASPEFERNHRYLMRVDGPRGALAEVSFWLRGTPARYDGHVDFGEGDAPK
jgi:hypothetical protein